MSLHVVVGAGTIGSEVAQLLAGRGEQVRIITRRGGGPDHPAIERVAADATDIARLTELPRGATALYNCANPPYHRWPTDWPPLHAALLAAAEATGAVLAITSNLYGYGPVSGPMTEDLPLASTGRTRRGGYARPRRAPRTTSVSVPPRCSPTPCSRRCSRAGPLGYRPAWTCRTASPTPRTWPVPSSRSPPTSGRGVGHGTSPRHRHRRCGRWPRRSPAWPGCRHPGWGGSRAGWCARPACSCPRSANSTRCATSSTGRSWSTRRVPRRRSD